MSEYAYSERGMVAPLTSRDIAKIDMPYAERNLPLTFFGVKHSRWTKQDMIEIIETLGGHGMITDNRIELYEMVHRCYNPKRILQRTITALGTKAQLATGRGPKLQEQVREAVEAATIERASLARERRAAAKPNRNFAPENHHIYSTQPVAKHTSESNYGRRPSLPGAKPWRRLDSETEGHRNLPQDSDPEYDQDHVSERRKQGPPAPVDKGMDWDGFDYRRGYNTHRRLRPSGLPRASSRQGKRANEDHEDFAHEKAPGPLQEAIFSTDAGGLEASEGRNRKRPAQPALETYKAKRRKLDPIPEATINHPGPSALIFGTSTAIRDSAASRLGLEASSFAGSLGHPPCQVCAEDWDPLLQFQVSVATGCTHEPEICLGCWERHIASEPDTKVWDAITCPHYKCDVVLNHQDMQRFAPAEVFRRYDNYQTNQTLQKVPRYRLCAHEGCGSGGFVEDEKATYMTCADCQRRTCLACNLIHHQGQTCEEYRTCVAGAERAHAQELKRNEKESAKYLSRTAKTCPNGACGAKIQKATGCDHMTCRICRHEFCWACLADFKRIRQMGNHWHERKCPYYFPAITTEAAVR